MGWMITRSSKALGRELEYDVDGACEQIRRDTIVADVY